MSAEAPILITGCSSGIGRAAAEHLARGGHTVYATARRLDDVAGLQRAGCRTLAEAQAGPYADYHAAVAKADAETDDSFIAGKPEQVARAIERARTARRPRPRYRVTPISRVLPKVRGLLGDRGFDALLRTQIKAPAEDA